jgi:hypothetical protein
LYEYLHDHVPDHDLTRVADSHHEMRVLTHICILFFKLRNIEVHTSKTIIHDSAAAAGNLPDISLSRVWLCHCPSGLAQSLACWIVGWRWMTVQSR